MRNSRVLGRAIGFAAVLVAAAALAVVLLGDGSGGYEVKGRFQNASQLVKGNLVQVAGAPIGSVKKIELTDGGEAEITMEISDEDYAPLRAGTLATIRQASLSGVANRYIDLRIPPTTAGEETIADGGVITAENTTTAVDLDQLFNTFDNETRESLRRLIRGYGTSYGGRGAQTNRGWQYLNPSLAASSRLFEELNRDTPLLRRFITASSQLVTDVAERRDDLAGLVDHLATTTGAIAKRREQLGDAVNQLPSFLRRANTTFVNLRATLDDLTPLVDDSKPVAKKLRPFLAELRPLARDARPTLRDLARLTRRAGRDNDLVELTRLNPALADIAVGQVNRNGKEREGALPASTKALRSATPEFATFRPYGVDLVGWFDDFSTSGVYDALGGGSRAAPHVNLFASVNGVLRPIPIDMRQQFFEATASLDQRWRCPGAIERGALWKPSPDFPCDETEAPQGS